MNAEFNLWLLVVGLVAGAGLVVLVLGRFGWPDDDTDLERWSAARWISSQMTRQGRPIDSVTAEEVLALRQDYLAGSDPDGDTSAGIPGTAGPTAADEGRWSLTPPLGPAERGNSGRSGQS